ncbi:MAG: class D sortase [Bacillota bacterium]
MKKLAWLLVVAGLLIGLYPQGERAYTWYWQQRLLTAWEEQLPETTAVATEEAPAEEPGEDDMKGILPRVPPPMGILAIDKINLELPLMRGATTANLRVGAGLLEAGADPGERGTAVITAHRSHTYGWQFNRLDELAAGDEIAITTGEAVYKYNVFKTEIVEPDAIMVQRGEGSETTLVLVTCHPLYSVNPPYRLVVRARQIEPVVQ